MRALIALVLLGALCTFATANYQYTSRRYGNRYGNTNYRNSNYGSSYRYGQRTSNSNNRNSYGYRYRVTCPKLADPANGAVKSSGYYLGDKAVHSCNSGFQLSGNRVRKCLSNGKWSGSAPVCQRVDCGGLQNINNGRVTIRPNTKFQSIAQYSCNAGHQLVGRSRRQCQADATWSGSEPSCVRVNCGSLDGINNGQVTVRPNTLFRSVATYSCNAGHQLVGSSRRQCQADATWSGREPSCVRVNCGSLEDIDNGDVSIEPDTRFQSVATYSCNAGHQLVGSSRRQCQADATWSGREPSCVRVNCGSLEDIDNGDVSIEPDTRFQSVATYSCNAGHQLVGSSRRQCQADATWSGREPSCVRVNCGSLEDIDNGDVSIEPDTRFQSVATYSCNAGHQLVGSSRRQCQADATWSGRAPSCVRVNCGSLERINNGDVSIEPDTRFQSVATYSCNAGHQLVGRSQRQCQADATWSGREPSCVRVNCGSLEDIDNGDVSINPDTRFQSAATYSCNAGFQLVGRSQRQCQADATWSGSEPSCVAIDCGNLQDIENGRVHLTGTQFRDTATYLCRPGFKLVGDRLRRCRANGQWSTVEPSCVAIDCGPLSSPANGDVSVNPDTAFGSTATYSCRRGFLLLGNRLRRCQADGQWSNSEPTCQKIKCPKLTTPSYGKLYTSGNHPGDHAVFSCTYGYSVIGKSRIVCLHTGVWSDSVPSCKKSYPDYDDKKYDYDDKKYDYDGPSLHDNKHDDYYYNDY